MQPVVELYVSASTANGVQSSYLDLYDNEPITLNLSVNDVRNFTQAKTSYSQEFVLPGTPSNSLFFNSIYEIGSDSFFDPRKKAECFLIVDSNVVMQGNLQLTDVSVDQAGNVTYRVNIIGRTNDLYTDLEGLYFTDLDWTALNHTFSTNNIVNSWTGTNWTNGYYYPLIDYGYSLNIPGGNSPMVVDPTKWAPALYNRYALDKIVGVSGKTFSSTFLNSSAYTETIMPFNGNQSTAFTLSASTLSALTFLASLTTNLTDGLSASTVVNSSTLMLSYPISNWSTSFPNFNGGGYTPSGGGDTYSPSTNSVQKFFATIGWKAPSTTPGAGIPTNMTIYTGYYFVCRFYRSGYQNATVPFHIQQSPTYTNADVDVFLQTGFETPFLNSVPAIGVTGQYFPLNAGETVGAIVDLYINIWTNGGIITATNVKNIQYPINRVVEFQGLNQDNFWGNKIDGQLVTGQTVVYNNIVPKNVLLTDYLKSTSLMFNLYFDVDKTNPSNLIIDTRDNYFFSGHTLDWTNKIDLKKVIAQQLIPYQTYRNYIFNYTDDSDYFNDNYLTKTKNTFGKYIQNFNNDFSTSDNELTVIFSPTPSNAVPEPNGTVVLPNNQVVIPSLYKLNPNNTPSFSETNLRFLRKNGVLEVAQLGMWAGFKFYANNTSTVYQAYPYAGHLDRPNSGQTMDYNFGPVQWEYYDVGFETGNNLINMYWKSYMNAITDKNSRMITAYFFLTPGDIASFGFNDTIFCSGLTSDGGHYFTVNSIEYIPTSYDSYKVELLKFDQVPVNASMVNLQNGGGGGGQGAQQVARQIVSYGNSQVLQPGSFSIGNDNVIGTPGSFNMGSGNIVNGGTEVNFIQGSGNVVGAGSSVNITGNQNVVGNSAIQNTITGNENVIPFASTGNTINGNNNIVNNS